MVAPVSPTAGQLIDKTFWDAQIYQQFVDLYASWTAFTPTWSGATTNPTIGNGTLDAAYKAIGKTAFVRIRMSFGSTSTAGSGLWGFTLPAAVTPATTEAIAGFITNSAGTVRHTVTGFLTAGSGVFRMALGNGSSGVSNTAPFAWATGDQLVMCGSYECA